MSSENNLLPTEIVRTVTSVPVFIGYTQKALNSNGESLNGKPEQINSLNEYELSFGQAENEKHISVDLTITKKADGSLQISAKAHIASPSANNMYFSISSYFDNGGGTCYIVSAGRTGKAIKKSALLSSLDTAGNYDEHSVIVFPEARAMTKDNYYSMIKSAIVHCAKMRDRFLITCIHTYESTTDLTIEAFRKDFLPFEGQGFAAVYYPDLIITQNYSYTDKNVRVTIHRDNTQPKTVKLKTLEFQEPAIYAACVAAIKELHPSLPPSPFIAGVYARNDNLRGVWKAPANITLNSVIAVTDTITSPEESNMNIDPVSGLSVNAIKFFTEKGIIVWGSRTLDGNSNEWKYISVRRFFMMVEESVRKSTKAFTTEPNVAATWSKIQALIERFLSNLWKEGALAGTKPEQAFFVKCGLGQTMTAQDLLDGRLIIEIGMAAVRPAEFIIIRIPHTCN